MYAMNLMKQNPQSSGSIRGSWRERLVIRDSEATKFARKNYWALHVLPVWRVELQRPPWPANTSASRTQSIDVLLPKKPVVGKMGACLGISRFDSCVRGFLPQFNNSPEVLFHSGATVAYTWHDYRPGTQSSSNSEPVAADAKDATSANSNAAVVEAPDAPPTPKSIPFWKRAAWSGFHVLGGCIAASLILATRSRIVRTVTYLPPARKGSKGPKSKPRIHLETAAHPYGLGLEVPLQDCLLGVGKEGDSKLKFMIKGQGHWIAPVMGAKVNGEPVPPTLVDAREHILKSWKRIGELGTVPKPSPDLIA